MTADSTSDTSPTKQRHPAVRWGIIVVLIPLVVFAVLKGCNLLTDFVHRDDVARWFGGPDNIETIQHPDRVTAQRLHLLDEWVHREGGFMRENYEPMGEPVTVSTRDADRLADWLTSGSSYSWSSYDESVGCHPRYGVKVSFDRGDQHLELWLCFECDILAVFEPIEYETKHDVGYVDMTLIHDELADIMQSLFPDDEAIRAL